MAVITNIDGIPLYNTIQEAIDWASSNGYSGYHTHTYQGEVGYMGGQTHSNVIADIDTLPQNVTTITSSIVSNSGGGY